MSVVGVGAPDRIGCRNDNPTSQDGSVILTYAVPENDNLILTLFRRLSFSPKADDAACRDQQASSEEALGPRCYLRLLVRVLRISQDVRRASTVSLQRGIPSETSHPGSCTGRRLTTLSALSESMGAM